MGRRHYARRDVIFHEGDPGDSLHLIESGQVAVRVTTRRGDSATLDILGAGDALGELALLPPAAPRSATDEALAPTDTLVLAGSAFHDLRDQYPGITTFLLALLVHRHRAVNGRLVEALYVPVEARLIRRLLDLAARFGGDGARPVVALSQDDLAGLAGTTRESVNRTLSQLVTEGMVDVTRGRVALLDIDALRLRAQ